VTTRGDSPPPATTECLGDEPAPHLEDQEDRMSDGELVRLNAALAKGFDSIKAGRFRPAADVIAELRRG